MMIDEKDRNSHGWFRWARVLEDKKEYESAVEAYRKVVEMNPNHVNAWYRMSIIYYNLGSDYYYDCRLCALEVRRIEPSWDKFLKKNLSKIYERL